MPVVGRVTPELSFLMAGAFQVLILPEKMPATASGESLRSGTPGRLYSTAMPPPVHGMVCTRPPLPTAAASSVADIGTSLAPKSMVPAVNCWMTAHAPTPWYVTVAPEHLAWKSLIHCWAMFWANVEPAPEIVPGSHATCVPVVAVLELVLLLLLPHAAATIDSATTTVTSHKLRLMEPPR